MKGVLKHKANADLGHLTPSLLINTARVRFSSPLLPHILHLFRTQAILLTLWLCIWNKYRLHHSVKRSILTSVLTERCSFWKMFVPEWFFIFSGTTYKLQLDSTIGTDVWRKVYILKYVITLLQLISTITLIYFANIQYVGCSLTLITLDDMQTVLLSLIRTVNIFLNCKEQSLRGLIWALLR